MDAGAKRLPLIGAQLSTAGGFAPVPQRAEDVGAEAVQIFNTNPRMWRTRVPAPDEVESLRVGLRKRRLRLFFHSIYLINLASPEAGMRVRAIEALARALSGGAVAGAEAVVTHIGSHRGDGPDEARARVVDSVSRAFDLARESIQTADATDTQVTPDALGTGGIPPLPTLLLETGAGSGNTLGGSLEDLAALLALHDAARPGAAPGGDATAGSLPGPPRAVPPRPVTPHSAPRLGICIDTAHLFTAGYAVHEESSLEELVAQFRALRLLDRIGLVHLNDSKAPFGSRRDHHENLGEGLIGYEGLARVVRHPALAHIPFILEVPGVDGHGPDAANVKLAKMMRAGLGPPARRAAAKPGTAKRAPSSPHAAAASRRLARKRPAPPAT